MRWRDIQLNLQKFEKEAKKLFEETGADHVDYGMKSYEDGHLASLSGVIVYALHKRD